MNKTVEGVVESLLNKMDTALSTKTVVGAPTEIGDTIIVDGITGVVDSINLISVRVHTYDNQMVRIPNSTIINANLIRLIINPSTS